MLERLRLQLERRHRIDIAAADLRAALLLPPLNGLVLRYPEQVLVPSDVQILVWNEDVDA
ncbi:MAG: hypothetical protein ACREXS_05400 [Gammaproteobacteria bacterium]